MERLKIATVCFGGCSGCHMSFLDLDEFLIDLAARVDVVYSPVVDCKAYPAGVAVCLIEGAICNADHLALLHRIRARTRVLVAFGDCAVSANVPALRNALGAGNVAGVLQCAYLDHAQDRPRLPAEAGIVPVLLDRVRPVHEVVYVEHFLPGCPPPADRIKALLTQLLNGRTPHLEGPQLAFG